MFRIHKRNRYADRERSHGAYSQPSHRYHPINGSNVSAYPTSPCTFKELVNRPTEDYMQMIVNQQKDHEFRKRLYPSTVQRIWFYETAPISAITYICDVGRAIIRPPQPLSPTHSGQTEWMLKTHRVGNSGFNNYEVDFEGYDYAYPIKSCWKITRPVSLLQLKAHGIKGAPRGMVYVSESLMENVKWNEQELIWREGK